MTATPLRGFWSVTGHPAVLETAAALRPDFVVIDTQHGVDLGALNVNVFTAIAHYRVTSLVRLPSQDTVDVGRALDLGADGVIAPMVETADQARTLVTASRYPPEGTRSFGIQTARVWPDQRPLCVALIETTAGIAAAAEIASVEGIDWLYIGPADLGLSLLGRPTPAVLDVFTGGHPDSEEIGAAWSAVVDAAGSHGKRAGLHCNSAEAARVALDHGFTVFAVSTDLTEVSSGLDRALRALPGDG